MNALRLLALGIFFPWLATNAHALTGDLDYKTVHELNFRYHNGTKGKSFNQAFGTYFAAEGVAGKKKFRPTMGFGVGLITGQASTSAGEGNGLVFTGGLHPGFLIHLMKDKKLQPFFKLNGIISWNYGAITPANPPSEEKSIGLGFGFQAGGGFYIANRNRTRAVRLHLSYVNYSSKLAGTTGFQLNAISLGIGFTNF